jgi:hypothetical protein
MILPAATAFGMAVRTADLHRFAPPGANAPSPVTALRATCATLPDGGMRLAFALEGRIAALRVLDQGTPDAWPLWQHTCFEAFLAPPGETGYREYNFSPAGLWAASAFRRYREIERDLTDRAPPPIIKVQQRDDALLLTAKLPSGLLPDSPSLQAGLSAVIERLDGQIEYWALRHPVAERADFHHRDGWTLRLDRERQP